MAVRVIRSKNLNFHIKQHTLMHILFKYNTNALKRKNETDIDLDFKIVYSNASLCGGTDMTLKFEFGI